MENEDILNKELLLTVKRIGINGEGIAYYKRQAVFIPRAIPGEIVNTEITAQFPGYCYGRIKEWRKISPDRVKPRCEYYGRCGGCQLQHIAYSRQLAFKKELTEEAFARYYDGKDKLPDVNDCLGMTDPWFYRNKTALPVRHDGMKAVVGMYESNSNRLVYLDRCLIENILIGETMKKILAFLTKASVNFYNPRFRKGDLRYIMVRGFPKTEEVQVTYVLMKTDKRLLGILKESIKVDNRIKSVCYTINDDPKAVEIITGKIYLLVGKAEINGKLGALNFKISPASFYQLNTIQTEVLYETIKKALAPTGNERVLDLYCGIGGIGLYLASSVKEVRGIDINPVNIADANLFVKENKIGNAFFYEGDILKQSEIMGKEFVPDVIIVDPPRKGLGTRLIDYLKRTNAKKIIYVSCNPSTLAKNLNHLQREYTIRSIQPIDMFPQTANVETVVLMSRKNA